MRKREIESGFPQQTNLKRWFFLVKKLDEDQALGEEQSIREEASFRGKLQQML